MWGPGEQTRACNDSSPPSIPPSTLTEKETRHPAHTRGLLVTPRHSSRHNLSLRGAGRGKTRSINPRRVTVDLCTAKTRETNRERERERERERQKEKEGNHPWNADQGSIEKNRCIGFYPATCDDE